MTGKPSDPRWKPVRAGIASLPGCLLRREAGEAGTPRAARGQALILIVFAIIGLVAITALAVDGGNAYADRRRAQNAADAAALAAALGRIKGEQWITQAYAEAKRNGYDNNGTASTVSITSPPTSGAHQGDIEYIDVQITSHVRTYFASVVGMRTITNTVEAIARSKPSLRGPMFGGAAVVSMASTSDCASNKAFYVHGTATLDVSGSDILVNSGNQSCALITQGQGSIRVGDGRSILVVGRAAIQKADLVSPYPPLTGWPAIDYPPPIFMPDLSCTEKAAISKTDPHTMTPGAWDDDFPPPDVTDLNSGVYCLGGDFIMTGKQMLTGSDVVFLMSKGQLRWSGTTLLNLSAPSLGDNRGLLVYQPKENKHQMILDAAEKSLVQGTFLAPAANIHIRGSDSSYGFHSQIIGYTIEVDGSGDIVVNYVASENYQALTMPEVQLVK